MLLIQPRQCWGNREGGRRWRRRGPRCVRAGSRSVSPCRAAAGAPGSVRRHRSKQPRFRAETMLKGKWFPNKPEFVQHTRKNDGCIRTKLAPIQNNFNLTACGCRPRVHQLPVPFSFTFVLLSLPIPLSCMLREATLTMSTSVSSFNATSSRLGDFANEKTRLNREASALFVGCRAYTNDTKISGKTQR